MNVSAAACLPDLQRGSSHMLAAYSHLVTTTYSRNRANSSTNTASGVSSSSDSSRSSAAGAPSKQQGQVTALQQQFGGLLPRPVMLQPQPMTMQKQKQPLQQQYGELLPPPVMLQAPAQQYSTQPQSAQQQQHQHQQQEAAAVVRLEASRQAYNQQLARQAKAAAASAAGLVSDASSGDVEQSLSSATVQGGVVFGGLGSEQGA